MVKNKKNRIKADKTVTDKIPYLRVFPEYDMMESKKNLFVKTYKLFNIQKEDIVGADFSIYLTKIEELINSFGLNVILQFTAFNKTNKNNNSILNSLIQDQKYVSEINIYNNVIKENATITDNNISQQKYFTLGLYADIPEEAIAKFKVIENDIKKAFKKVYHINIEVLSITEKSHLLYDMLNPNERKFGYIAGIHDGSDIDFKQLTRLNLSSKDLVAPQVFDTSVSLKNHLKINNKYHARSFFINTLPPKIADYFLSDLTNVISNLIYTVTMEPYDAECGMNLTKQAVVDNTIVKNIKVINTLEDKRNNKVIKIEKLVNKSERDYFNLAALNVCTNASALNQHIFGCTAVITIFAENLEDLNHYDNLLRISASKYAVQLKSLDVQQLQGLQSVLPLCNVKIDTKRILDSTRAAGLVPIDFNHITQINGQYYGINQITDKLIILNRRNNINPIGMITGTKSSGKSYQCKREIFNALISNNDDIIVISNNPEDYTDFIKRFHGSIITDINTNPFAVANNYALNNDGYVLKKYFLKGLLNIYTGHTNNYDLNIKIRNINSDDNLYDDIIDTCLAECNEIPADKINDYLVKKYPEIASAFKTGTMSEDDNRLKLYLPDNILDFAKLMDHIWLKVISNKKAGKDTWIFIDSMDELFNYPDMKDYIIDIVNYCAKLNTVFTFVLQNPADMAVSNNTSFSDFIKNIGYVKLLNQGIKERMYFADLLSISNILLKYISPADQGHIGSGLIITETSNIVFDDCYNSSNQILQDFHKIFEKKIKQNEIDYNNLSPEDLEKK